MFTVKSTSSEGVYFLVNGWYKHNTFWIEEKNLKPDMLFKSPRFAKTSLTKLLKVMTEYKTDSFELVAIDENMSVESMGEIQLPAAQT